MILRRWRIRTFDFNGVIMESYFWTEGGALSYLNKWIRWYLRKYEMSAQFHDVDVTVVLERYAAGGWHKVISKTHYDYMNELLRRGVIA